MAEPTPGSTVLLYSGGMDSYCAAALLRPDVLLHVDTGTAYGDVEASLLRAPAGCPEVTRTALRDLGGWERPGSLILPGRNAHLVLLGAHYADRVWLGATAGDRVQDKDPEFAARISMLLGHMYGPQWWLPEGRDVRCELPVKHLTKHGLVCAYLGAGGEAEALRTDTLSCYYPDHSAGIAHGLPAAHCGRCKPCVRKWIALTVCYIDPGYDARESVRSLVDIIESGQWDRGDDEAADVMESWRRTA